MDMQPKEKGDKFASIALAVIAVVILVGLGFYLADRGSDISGTVAIVNGQEISGEDLSRQLESLNNATSTQAEQFNDLSKTRQREILLEGIINTELQLQAAEEAGVEVTDEEVASRLQTQIDQIGQEEFERRLEENDVTEEEVTEDLRRQMIIEAYIQQEAGGEITPTEQEVQALYDQYIAQFQQAAPTSSSQVPALSELRPQVEAAVIQQKQQQLSQELLETARENAEIEVLLDGVSYPPSPGEGELEVESEAGTSTDVDTAATTS